MISPGDSGSDRMHGPRGTDITCQEALDRLFEFLDGELEPEWMERVRGHIAICRHCWPRFDVERVFLDHIAARGLAPTRSRRLERRVREILRNAAE